MVQTQIADANGRGKPSLRNVTVTPTKSKPSEMTTLEFDQGARRLESSKFAVTSRVKLMNGATAHIAKMDFKCDPMARNLEGGALPA